LLPPLEHYQIGSRFGPRRDPFNGRSVFHSGLDFDAGFMSPIYATALGIVTYAGYRRDYGKVVEIDHGSGIVTLYGHMHHYTVSVGQRVEAHMQIGLLGSTGRASGPAGGPQEVHRARTPPSDRSKRALARLMRSAG
jgi:murein DD-endopeptidase MepM/ murein hydrolase activator NlpD